MGRVWLAGARLVGALGLAAFGSYPGVPDGSDAGGVAAAKAIGEAPGGVGLLSGKAAA